MSELSYKELQEKGIFDVPYRAFEFMQQQQTNYDELEKLYIQQGLNMLAQQQKTDSALNRLCALQYSSGERCYKEIKEILG